MTRSARILLLALLPAALATACGQGGGRFAGALAESAEPGFGVDGPGASGLLVDAYADTDGDGVPDTLVQVAPVADEIWVIERPPAGAAATEPGGVPGAGCLLAAPDPSAPDMLVPVPLAHTDVRARIAGFVAEVDVVQRFENPFDGKIEAVYRFPLPQDASVHELVIAIGERTIRGIVRPREEAEELYLEARRQGYVASLLTQERPNLFTQSVANLEPGAAIDVSIRYLHVLPFLDGELEWRFPMVVAPRYNPPGTTGGIAAVPRGAEGTSGQAVEVSYLAPHERSGHDVSLEVELEGGLPPEGLDSPTHAVEVVARGETGALVRLKAQDSIPDRDFVLRWRPGGEGLRATMLTAGGEDGDGYFALMLLPPDGDATLPRRSIELCCVIDRSGSMDPVGLELARRAVRRALGMLDPDDEFNLVSFADSASSFRASAIAATSENLKAGLRWLDRLDAEGGTEMLGAVEAALDGRADTGRLRCVAFLTDGHVGNEEQVLLRVAQRLGDARLFSFAIGSASNQFLADRMAVLGRGAVAFIGPEDDAEGVMERFLERVRRPALTDVAVDFGDMQVREVFPARVPDLFAGRPVVVTGRFRGAARPVALEGDLGGAPYRRELGPAVDVGDHLGVPLVWARRKIASLADAALVAGNANAPEVRTAIEAVALEHGIACDFTAFVAVDSSRVTAGEFGTTVGVPVPVPRGMRYDTTVGGR